MSPPDRERLAIALNMRTVGLKLLVALANEYDLDAAAEIDYSRVRTVREIAEYVHELIAPGGEQ